MKHSISLTINGDPVDAIVKDNLTLLDFLRDQLLLTGTKKGGEEGECGACTVLLDNKPVNSCCTLAVECDGHEIVTVEGIARDSMLHPIQKQFIEKWAMQCGYCTPGMIMSAKALLDENHHPTELEIREAIEGNLCRCTGYAKIVEAIQAAAEQMNWEEESEDAAVDANRPGYAMRTFYDFTPDEEGPLGAKEAGEGSATPE